MNIGLIVLESALGPEGQWLKVAAEPGTPAARAGIQRGDIIMKMGDLYPAEWRLKGSEIPATGLRLDIKRGGKHIALVVNHPSASAASVDKLPAPPSEIPASSSDGGPAAQM